MAATIKILVSADGGGLDNVKREIGGLGKAAQDQGGGFNGLKEIATGAFRQIGAAAVDLAGRGLQAMTGFIKDSISAAADFESGMNAFGAAAGKGFEPGTAALKDFNDLFIQLGKDLPVSTKEVQDAAIALVKGGIDPAVIRAGALKDSLNFAAAAGMGLEKAAELTVKQLGTFVPIGASVTEQTEFMAKSQDLLVKAAGASTLNVDKLGDAMLAAGGQARAAGLNYEDFVTTMGLISPSFGSAAEAGTSFKNLLVRLQPSTDKATQAMEALGLITANGANVFFDSTGKFMGMKNAAEKLKGALAGLSDAERISALQTIFGNDAMAAASALAASGAAGYEEFAKKMAKANGVTAQAAAKQKGFAFAVTNLKGTLEALQITIGTKVLPVLTPLIERINTALGKVLEFTNTIFGATDPLLKFAEIVRGWSEPLGTILGYFIRLVRGGDGVNEWLKATPGWFQVAIGAINTLKITIAELTMRFGEFKNIVAPIIDEFVAKVQTAFAEGGIGGVLRMLADQLARVSPGFALIKGTAEAAWPVIQQISGVFADAGAKAGGLGGILNTLGQTWESLKTTISLVVGAILNVVNAVFGEIAKFLKANSGEISGFLAKAWKEINEIIQLACQLIKVTIVPIFNGIADFIRQHSEQIQGVFSGVWKIISSIITTALETIKGLLKAALAIIQGDWQGAWDAIKGILSAQLKGLIGIIEGAGTIFANAVQLLLGAIKKTWETFVNWSGLGGSMIDGIISGILDGIGGLVEAAKKAAEEAWHAAKNAIGMGSPAKLFMPVGESMSTGMAVGMLRAVPALAGAAQLTSASALAGATYMNQRSLTLNYTANNYNTRSAQQDYAVMSALARSYA